MKKSVISIICLIGTLFMMTSCPKSETKLEKVHVYDATIFVNQTMRLSVSCTPKEVVLLDYIQEWESSDKNVATVSKNGTVQGISSGTTEITLVVKDKETNTKLASTTATVRVKEFYEAEFTTFGYYGDVDGAFANPKAIKYPYKHPKDKNLIDSAWYFTIGVLSETLYFDSKGMVQGIDGLQMFINFAMGIATPNPNKPEEKMAYTGGEHFIIDDITKDYYNLDSLKDPSLERDFKNNYVQVTDIPGYRTPRAIQITHFNEANHIAYWNAQLEGSQPLAEDYPLYDTNDSYLEFVMMMQIGDEVGGVGFAVGGLYGDENAESNQYGSIFFDLTGETGTLADLYIAGYNFQGKIFKEPYNFGFKYYQTEEGEYDFDRDEEGSLVMDEYNYVTFQKTAPASNVAKIQAASEDKSIKVNVNAARRQVKAMKQMNAMFNAKLNK